MEKMVTIITPCYNGEKYIARFLDSVLQQSYACIELIVIDDGSTDMTSQILNSYVGKFGEKGFRLNVIHQENSGQAEAINKGLKEVKGEYIMWIDSDDILLPEHVQEKVVFLENNPQYGMMSCWGYAVNEGDIDHIVDVEFRAKPIFDWFFFDLIIERNVVLNPGVYMVRKCVLDEAIPTKSIYASRQGQNLQLLLPLAFITKCGYLDKPLFKIVRRQDSHSRAKRSVESKLKRCEQFQKLICETIYRIPKMGERDKKKWCVIAKKRFHYLQMIISETDQENLLCKVLFQLIAKLEAFKYRYYSSARKRIVRNKLHI